MMERGGKRIDHTFNLEKLFRRRVLRAALGEIGAIERSSLAQFHHRGVDMGQVFFSTSFVRAYVHRPVFLFESLNWPAFKPLSHPSTPFLLFSLSPAPAEEWEMKLTAGILRNRGRDASSKTLPKLERSSTRSRSPRVREKSNGDRRTTERAASSLGTPSFSPKRLKISKRRRWTRSLGRDDTRGLKKF